MLKLYIIGNAFCNETQRPKQFADYANLIHDLFNLTKHVLILFLVLIEFLNKLNVFRKL